MKNRRRVARGENIITIDADYTYPVETVSAIVKGLGNYDLVIASRRKVKKIFHYLTGSAMPLLESL